MANVRKIAHPMQSKIDAAVIVAVIGLVGTLVTALLKPIVDQWAVQQFAPRPSLDVSLPAEAGVSPSAVVDSILPTPSPTMPVSSPVPTATYTPLPPAPTKEASLECLAVENWVANTTDVNIPFTALGGCLDLTAWGISNYDDTISILRYGTRRAEWYGVSRLVPKNSTITFSLLVKDVQKGELWFGISEGASPTYRGVYLVRGENDMFDIRSCASDSCRSESGKFTIPDDHGKYEIRFELVGNRLNVVINDFWQREDIQVLFSNRRFYVGLVPFANAYLNAELGRLTIQEK